jgi:hypothetical protein
MLTLKTYLVENRDDTLLHFSLDTDELNYLSNMDRFCWAERNPGKRWIGSVDRKRNEFRVMRSVSGLFTPGIQINGRVTADQKEIEIKYKLSWVVTVTLIWVSILSCILVFNFFNNSLGWAMLGCFITLQLLFLLLDFRKTEGKFLEYIAQLRNSTPDKGR